MRRLALSMTAAVAAAAMVVAGATPGGAEPTPDVTESPTLPSPSPPATPSPSPPPPPPTPDPPPPPRPTEVTVTKVDATSETARFPVYDASGAKVRDALWRVTDAGGSCCEVYVSSTADGRLLEFGGTYPTFSDDRGVTWQRVEPGTPVRDGKGAIVAAPNGDVVGVGWDASTADNLLTYKYDAASKAWAYAKVALHQPLFDRPLIATFPGPFTLDDGTTVPYATVLRSGAADSPHEVFLVSFDGLSYLPSDGQSVQMTGPPHTAHLEPAVHPALDHTQPHQVMRVTPLPRGGFFNVVASWRNPPCPSTRYRTNRTWQCQTVPLEQFDRNLLIDSRGRLHAVTKESGGTFRYLMSPDGARSWRSTALVVPGGGSVVHDNLLDFKVNAALEQAVVAVRADIGSGSQDLVYRLDTTGSAPRLLETMYVGKGDVRTAVGVNTARLPRFDLSSVTLLPDGTVAMAFADSGHATPRLAVEVPGERPSPSPTTGSPTPTPSESPSATPSVTPSESVSESPSETPSATPTPSETPTPTTPPPPPADTTAPAAGAILPVRLTDPTVVEFDERVSGVTATNVALRLADGTVVPATRRCRNGAVAAFCDRWVTEVELRPVAALRPGEHYAVAIAPPGTGVPSDAAGNPAIPATFTFRASTDEDHSTAAAAYAWRALADRAALGGSYAVERRAGAHVSYPFSGTSVTWFGATGPDQGMVRVLVDGVDRGTVDTYSATRRWRVGHVVSGLAPGRHVLTLRVLGTRSARSSGTNVVVDAVRAASGTFAENPVWTYAWATASLPQQGSAAVADHPGAQVAFEFRGTGFEWVTALAPDAGRAAVYVDGRHVATVDNYAATRRYGVRRAVEGLPDGVHRVVVRVLPPPIASRGTLVVVDRWLVH